MKRFLEGIRDHPRECFDIYVYFVGAFIISVLARNGHMIVAALQGIIWAGYCYARHRDSLKERDHQMELRETRDKLDHLRAMYSEVDAECKAARSLLTDDQQKELFEIIIKKPAQ